MLTNSFYKYSRYFGSAFRFEIQFKFEWVNISKVLKKSLCKIYLLEKEFFVRIFLCAACYFLCCCLREGKETMGVQITYQFLRFLCGILPGERIMPSSKDYEAIFVLCCQVLLFGKSKSYWYIEFIIFLSDGQADDNLHSN